MQNNNYSDLLDLNADVDEALQAGRPVVALESTIICHGMPYPQNVETALEVEKIIRANGATPATIAILKGRLKVGLTESEIDYLGREGQRVVKASRRDMPMAVSRQQDAATTVASSSASSRAPAIQPVHKSISLFAASGTAFCTRISPI